MHQRLLSHRRAKPFTASHKVGPYYVRELEERIQDGYDRGFGVAKGGENDFLDGFSLFFGLGG